MPRILVVFYSPDDVSGALADAVADGAESVRFAEVDVRHLGDAASHVSASKPRRQIASADELAAYDAIIVGGPTEAGEIPAELAALFGSATTASVGFADKVGSAFTPSANATGELPAARIMAGLASLGMILIPSVGASGSGTLLDRGRAMGRRVAQVTGWVGHSLGHERGHAHHHHEPDSHEHSQPHESGAASDHGHGHSHGDGHSHEHSHDAGHRH